MVGTNAFQVAGVGRKSLLQVYSLVYKAVLQFFLVKGELNKFDMYQRTRIYFVLLRYLHFYCPAKISGKHFQWQKFFLSSFGFLYIFWANIDMLTCSF
jgi:hypothetical protein